VSIAEKLMNYKNLPWIMSALNAVEEKISLLILYPVVGNVIRQKVAITGSLG
jgi:hypothetical protein